MNISAEQASSVLKAGIEVNMYHGGTELPEDEKKLISEAEDMLELVAQICKVASFNGTENTPNWDNIAKMMTLVGQDPEQELAKARGEQQAPPVEQPPAAPVVDEPAPAAAPEPVVQPVQAPATPEPSSPPAEGFASLTQASNHVAPEKALPKPTAGEIWEGPDGQQMMVSPNPTSSDDKVAVRFPGMDENASAEVPRSFLVRCTTPAPQPGDGDYAGPKPAPPVGSGNPVEHQVQYQQPPAQPAHVIANNGNDAAPAPQVQPPLPPEPTPVEEHPGMEGAPDPVAARAPDPVDLVMSAEVSPPTPMDPEPQIRAIEIEPQVIQSVGGFGAIQAPVTAQAPQPAPIQQAAPQPAPAPSGGFTSDQSGFASQAPASQPESPTQVQETIASSPDVTQARPAPNPPFTSDLVPMNQEEVVEGELIFPLHNSDGDEQYKKVLDEVEERRTPSGFPVPRELTVDLPIIPDDSANMKDSDLKDLHLQFNALAARARFIHDLESDYARSCKVIRDGYYRKAVKAARASMGKDATLEEVKHEAEEDEDVQTWTARCNKHEAEARSYKTFFDINSDNVKVLSRDWTMRDREQQNA